MQGPLFFRSQKYLRTNVGPPSYRVTIMSMLGVLDYGNLSFRVLDRIGSGYLTFISLLFSLVPIFLCCTYSPQSFDHMHLVLKNGRSEKKKETQRECELRRQGNPEINVVFGIQVKEYVGKRTFEIQYCHNLHAS